MTTIPWTKAISCFPVLVGGAGRAVGGVVRHGNILAFFVAVCGSPLAYYLFACGGIPFVPFRSLSPPT